MPTDRALARAQKDQREDNSAGMPGQAIAVGLSQARRAGIDMPEAQGRKKRPVSKAAAKKRAGQTRAGSRAAGAVRAARTRAMRSRSR